MYQIQLQWNKQGEWMDTVYHPMPLMRALDIMADLNQLHSEHHCYRVCRALDKAAG